MAVIVTEGTGTTVVATLHDTKLFRGTAGAQIATIDANRVFRGIAGVQLLHVMGGLVSSTLGGTPLVRIELGKIYRRSSDNQIAAFADGVITEGIGNAIIGRIGGPVTTTQLAAVLHLVFAIF